MSKVHVIQILFANECRIAKNITIMRLLQKVDNRNKTPQLIIFAMDHSSFSQVALKVTLTNQRFSFTSDSVLVGFYFLFLLSPMVFTLQRFIYQRSVSFGRDRFII